MKTCLLLFHIIFMVTLNVYSRDNHWERFKEDDSFLAEVVSKAPYLKHRLDIYQKRLAKENDPSSIIQELFDQIGHYFFYWVDDRKCRTEKLSQIGFSNNTLSWDKIWYNLVDYFDAADILVNNTTANCWNPSMAVSQAGDRILIVWQDERSGVNKPEIYGQFLDLEMNRLGENFKVNLDNTSAKLDPYVATTSDGGFAVVWEDYRNETPFIYYRRIAKTGAFLTNDIKVNSEFKYGQYFPTIAADSAGSFTIAWFQDDGSDFNIYCRKFQSLDDPLTVTFRINNDNGTNLQWAPDIASLPDGKTLIVWEDKRNGNSDIYGQRLHADGSKRGGNFMVNYQYQAGTQRQAFVVANSNKIIVCWEDSPDQKRAIFAQWFDASLLSDGGNERIDDGSANSLKEFPTVSLNSNGESIFSWQDSRDGNWDVYAHRYSASKEPLNFLKYQVEHSDLDQLYPSVFLLNEMVFLAWLEKSEGNTQNIYVNKFDMSVVPVELRYFKAKKDNNKVTLVWETASESNNFGFEIEKKSSNCKFNKIAFIRGHGTCSDRHIYHFIDNNLFPGAYFYRLKQIDNDGKFQYLGVIQCTIQRPEKFAVLQNYPNPFNSYTIIACDLPRTERVRMEIYDSAGQLVRTLVNGILPEGYHRIRWDGCNDNAQRVSSGVYVLKSMVGSKLSQIKMSFLK